MSSAVTGILCMLEKAIVILGQLSLLVLSFTATYLVIKYKSLAFWWSGSKKELFFVRIGFIGFVTCSIVGIVVAVLLGR